MTLLRQWLTALLQVALIGFGIYVTGAMAGMAWALFRAGWCAMNACVL